MPEEKIFLQRRQKKIERLFFGEDYVRADASEVGTINFPERTTESYRAKFLQFIDEEFIQRAKMKIVIDYANGVASTIFPNLLGSLQCEVVSLNAYLDPTKLTRTKEETDAAVKNVSNIVTSLKYDLGCVIDAGAEKITLIDENGKEISDDRLLTLVTKLFLTANPETKNIAVPVASSAEIESVASQFNTKVWKTRNTHLAMMEASQVADVKFVGGTKGGFIFTDFFFAVDGMFSFAKILELLGKTKQQLGKLDNETVRLHRVYRNVPCSWDDKGKLMRMVMKDSENIQRELVDGVRLIFSQDAHQYKNLLILPDKEEAMFHLFAEATTQTEAQHVIEEYQKKMLRWREMN